MKKTIFIICGILIACCAFAEIPKTINYQGRLTGAEGNPVADGSYSLTLSIYDNLTGGNLEWSGVYSADTKDGYFNLVLGGPPANAFPQTMDFSENYYLEVKVGADPPMSPRQALNSTPYAIRAEYVNIPQVHSGEKDITDYSGGTFYVLLTKTPREITLSLHLQKFNEIYYREIALHQHSADHSGTTGNNNVSHSHDLRVGTGYGPGGSGWIVSNAAGADHMQPGWIDNNDSSHVHNYSFSINTGTSGGDIGVAAIVSAYTAKTFLSDLRISLNGVEITSEVLSRAGISGPIDATDSLRADIGDLSQWSVGENTIVFYQSAGGGGKVIYDLYVWY
ncbi:hypothetical protein KAR34_10125 [bacterium]|nr:hypothetical protein [bacterium]